MSEQELTQTAEMAATEKPEQSIETIESLKSQIERMQLALKEANKESAGRRIKLQEYEQAEEKRKLESMTEAERLKEELKKRDAELAILKVDQMRRAAAAKIGLPEVLTNRIQGETIEEMLADAEQLFTALPKPQTATVGMTQPATTSKLTREAIAKMTTDEINKNWDAVQTALSER